ncbi:MAG: HAD family hydrolase [Deltaproteobacteria bacterium]|nr:HAD family hydrolase [Deltaproteobacteria bacterium]
MKTAAVFLDRDGTINVDTGYLGDPADVALIDGAAEAVAALNRAGIKAIVISNQSGVGRGFFTDADAARVTERLVELLAQAGARLDGMYYCPHRPDEDCRCRKPRTGLVEAAAAEHGIDLERSCVIGDKASDIGLARNLGINSALVLTGNGRADLPRISPPPEFVANDLREAAGWAIKTVMRGKTAARGLKS